MVTTVDISSYFIFLSYTVMLIRYGCYRSHCSPLDSPPDLSHNLRKENLGDPSVPLHNLPKIVYSYPSLLSEALKNKKTIRIWSKLNAMSPVFSRTPTFSRFLSSRSYVPPFLRNDKETLVTFRSHRTLLHLYQMFLSVIRSRS